MGKLKLPLNVEDVVTKANDFGFNLNLRENTINNMIARIERSTHAND